jgi:TDG/mug DNA glycosylase family protein
MDDLFGIATSLPHDARAAALVEHQIAVWDVCAAARRAGSLDSNIQASSVVTNDFERFLSKHAQVGLICFNGAKAGALFEARVVPNLSDELRKISRKILPSTSPAHASVSYEAKRAAWEIVDRRVYSAPLAMDPC